ncbi:MAG: C-GCAxxG-C-C family protein [Candidatus Bathyarchaeia archaeon]
MSNSEVSEKAYKLAFEYESKYGNCPQCVIAAIGDVFSLKLDELFKASHGLAGGLGLSGSGTCGALSGGSIVLSHFYGRNRENFHKRVMKSYEKSKLLYDKFVEEFGGCTCREVQQKLFGRSFNLWDAEDYKRFEEEGGHRDKCPSVTGKVAKWVAEILINDPSLKLLKH